MAKELKPLTLNVQKAYEIIGKFNMVPHKANESSNAVDQLAGS